MKIEILCPDCGEILTLHLTMHTGWDLTGLRHACGGGPARRIADGSFTVTFHNEDGENVTHRQ